MAIILFFIFYPLSARAASLYLSPASGAYALNSNIAVGVYVSSADKAMNAVSGALDFPADKLQVVSISKSGSVINLWVAEPSYSNSNGTINFEGVALNPGYTGANGKIITINFRVKGADTGALKFTAGSVLANDGQGTEILTGSSGAQFTLGEGKPVPLPEPEIVPPGKPAAPAVSSATHPDESKWYNIKDAQFAWQLPAGISKARILVDSQPDSVPSVVYAPAIKEKELKEVGDGQWYFHVQLYNDKGWGGTTHFRFQIDTVNPTGLKIAEIKRPDPTDPRAAFLLSAADELSGVDYYETRVDNNEPIIWKDDGSHRFETGPVSAGNHILTVKVFDKAGNHALDSALFTIAPLAAPIVENYPKQLRTGDALSISGHTYPNANVAVYLQRGAGEPIATIAASDAAGKFVYAPETEMRSGVYTFWLQASNASGARSELTKKFSVVVSEPLIFRFGSFAVSVLAVFIPLLALVGLLLAALWYGHHKFKIMRNRLGAKVREITLMRKAFELLRADIMKDIRSLEQTRLKRRLTDEEERIVNKLEQDMTTANLILKSKPESDGDDYPAVKNFRPASSRRPPLKKR